MKELTELTLLNRDGCNIDLRIGHNHTTGIFRIRFSEESRKNSRHKTFTAKEAYIEVAKFTLHTAPYQTSGSYEISRYTDLLLFVERNKQWFLEQIRKELD